MKDGLTASKEILESYTQSSSSAAASGSKSPHPLAPVIIAMTASAMEADRKSCSAAGMVDFVAKPVHLSSLRQKIELWAEKINAARQRVQNEAVHLPANADSNSAPSSSSSSSSSLAVPQHLKPKLLPKLS